MLKNREGNAPSHISSNFWDALLLDTVKPRTWKDLGDSAFLSIMCCFSNISNSRQLYPSGQEISKQEHKVSQSVQVIKTSWIW